MKKEDKSLLIKDLCARLLYGVKVKSLIDGKPVTLTGFDSTPIPHFYDENDAEWDIEDIKPYLLPISSMTEGQRKEYNNSTYGKYWHYTPTIETYNWLNEHHFDYYNLIGRNLAIDCTNLNIY